MVKIGDIELRGNLTLAPMAGVTDFAFRRVCRALGAAFTTTEMVSAKALVYKDERQNLCSISRRTSTPAPRRYSAMNRT